MKVYSIGREAGCDIVINDRTDVISRRHATLTVMSFGKMTITDQSTNGTYVNGIRIQPNTPFPVSRKDKVSFAHVARLDWNQVPDDGAAIMRWSIIGAVTILLIVCAVFGYRYLNQPDEPVQSNKPVVVDSAELRRQWEIEQAERNQHIKDSIARAKQDSIDSVKNAQANKPCPVCKKKISACEYGGKHPATCKYPGCGKTINQCPYHGKHPKKTVVEKSDNKLDTGR